MFSKARLITSLFLLFFLSAPFAEAKTFDWQAKRHANRTYFPLDRVSEFYRYSLVTSGRKILLTNKGKVAPEKTITIEFSPGGQEVIMNGVKFIFSFPIIAIGGKYHLCETDFNKILDPVLRPSYIANAKPFDTVIIDPGHGGRDPGCVNSLGTEAGYNLKVAKLLEAQLRKLGFKVVMTRDSDRFISLSQRVTIANKYRNAIFVSIHFNSIGGAARSQARGIETFTLSPEGVAHYGSSVKASDLRKKTGNQQDSANIALATSVHWNIKNSLADRKKGPGIIIPDRGIRRARFNVLTGVKHPAILIEGGFMSHPEESRHIHKSTYQSTMAKAVCNAIYFYRVTTNPKTKKR
ncbi:N-acetylmuramoyl-L-alanine amidase [bacterium]|nr:N-acetylmuramoyl-L-alanine amidase [bacterium]MDB4726587.1 N-acetylmuramoyl-L-alanine amidase [bacterium]MDB4735229.1 N-acetylmuramoyl-L-alanine amidase [Akkermansiaceae bacterium]